MSKVAIIWNMDIPPGLSLEQQNVVKEDIRGIYNMMIRKVGKTYIRDPSSWIITGCTVPQQLALFIVQMKLYGNMEFLSTGMYPDQDLATLPFGDQKAIIAEAKRLVETLHVCGRNPFTVTGFFSECQNGDTLAALDELGFTDNLGITWPVLHDRDAAMSGMTPQAWLDALKSEFNSGTDMAVVFDLSISGVSNNYYLSTTPDEWLYSTWKFLEYVRANGGSLVFAKDF